MELIEAAAAVNEPRQPPPAGPTAPTITSAAPGRKAHRPSRTKRPMLEVPAGDRYTPAQQVTCREVPPC